jgi:uncharacterized membrane protein YeaQ/YmgE (transglycosylase-associated protein family)
MNFLLWIVFGAIVGWLASVVMGTNKSQGLLMDIVLGLIGALAGGLVMSLFGESGVTGFNLYSFFVALVGAIGLVWAGRRLA